MVRSADDRSRALHSSEHKKVDASPRRYRFSITVDVEPDHPAHEDPEWVADAAWGSLTNEYGLRASYGSVEELPADDPI